MPANRPPPRRRGKLGFAMAWLYAVLAALTIVTLVVLLLTRPGTDTGISYGVDAGEGAAGRPRGK